MATFGWAQARAVAEGRVFVAPYDDPYTIAGQGTVGQEIMKQCPNGAKQLTHIFVPVGGGGLIAGIAAFVKAVRPDIAIIGVEPTGAPAPSRPGALPGIPPASRRGCGNAGGIFRALPAVAAPHA